jgi:hypothetical protein
MTTLVYMAKPVYGGWVTFTAHLCLKYNCELYKIGKRTETFQRDYGYNVKYQNLRIDDILLKPNLVITALDKHYWKYLYLFPENTTIIIHDPTELKGKDNPLPKFLHKFNVITIRETVQTYLKDVYNIKSTFKIHPFYNYEKSEGISDYESLSISRIDFDKHTDLILKANMLIENTEKQIQIFGAENRLYVHHKLKELEFELFWKGKYPKNLPLQHNDKDLLNSCKFVVDMSIIKGDGGGTQYTFLEAIYHDCALILHHDWVSKGDTFKKNYNCFVVGENGDENVPTEIKQIIMEDNKTKRYKQIIKHSKELLNKHINVKWF